MGLLFSLANVRKIAVSAPIVAEGDDQIAVYLVVDGSVEIALRGHAETPLARLRPGDCFSNMEGESPAWNAVAAEPCSVMRIGPPMIEQLGGDARSVLLWKIAIESSARFDALASRYMEAERRVVHLSRFIRLREVRDDRVLASPEFRAIIKGIPRLPLHATDLLGKLLDDRLNANDAVESIKDNPPLAALVLKTVNSAYYGLRSKVADYYHAFLLLGVNTVYQIVLSDGIRSAVIEGDSHEAQARAFLVSLIAHEISVLSKRSHPPLMTTVGLLHDIGRPASAILKKKRPELGPVVDVIEPARIGSALLASWDLPKSVVEAVRRQHDPDFTPYAQLRSPHKTEIAILYLAHHCADLALGDRATPAAKVFAGEYLKGLGFDAPDIETFFEEVVRPSIAKQREMLPAPMRDLFPRTGAEIAAA